MQCHTIKIVEKLDIYNRFKNDRRNDGALGFFEDGRLIKKNKKKNNNNNSKMSIAIYQLLIQKEETMKLILNN